MPTARNVTRQAVTLQLLTGATACAARLNWAKVPTTEHRQDRLILARLWHDRPHKASGPGRIVTNLPLLRVRRAVVRAAPVRQRPPKAA